ncbi:OmpA family protein [Eisenibacter elegans]|jgi:outer membrane protein OmpA-like peptidoglycan-associated protein|uniref:OmpA family protein n=1 Tax=Eisenibacter elegans TaxID=997 RepID=UPI000408BFC6|nr:OmpA family protein [Eisenibacter elegans]
MPYRSDTLYESAVRTRKAYAHPRATLEEMRAYALEVAFSEEEWDEVIRIFQNHWQKGDSFLKNNNWDDAIAALEKAYPLEPMHEGLLFDLAEAYAQKWVARRRRRFKQKAIFYAQACLEANPANRKAARIITQLKTAPKRYQQWFTARRRKLIFRRTIQLLGLGLLFWGGYRFANSELPWAILKQFESKDEAPENLSASLYKAVYFDEGSIELNAEAITLLNLWVSYLKADKYKKGQISGHSDNYGTPAVNMQVSTLRAKRVYDYLVQQGIEPHRLHYKGYGDSQPAYPNDSPTNRALNRRVQFVLRAFE